VKIFRTLSALVTLVVFSSHSYADNWSDAISRINGIRKASGLGRLSYDPRLRKAAYAHARYLASNGVHSHTQKRGKREYSGATPSERIARAGYGCRVVVENISFGDKSYSHSVDTLMATLYHRLGFLDMRIDEIGAGRAGRKSSVFVYDMSSSVVKSLCRGSGRVTSGEYIYGICADSSKKISKREFDRAVSKLYRKSAKVVLYPYDGEVGVARHFVNELVDPLGGRRGAGYPVTVQLNPAYYHPKGKPVFELFDSKGKRVSCRKFDFSNDPHHLLRPGSYAIIPNRVLKRGERYKVRFSIRTDRGRVSRNWSFVTGKR